MSFGTEHHAEAAHTDTAIGVGYDLPAEQSGETEGRTQQEGEAAFECGDEAPSGRHTASGPVRATSPPPDDIFARIKQRKNVKVKPLAEAIGMSFGGLYQAIGRGDVKSVTIGRAVFVPAHEAARLLGLAA